MKKLYGIGTGPGDKELLTLRAVRAIEESHYIFAPRNKGETMAMNTVKDFIGDKEIVYIDLPMGKVSRENYIEAAKLIMGKITEDKKGAFLTIGDPMIYSSFTYLMEELDEEEIDIEIISGIPSFVAAAGAMKFPLTSKGESFILCDEFDEEKIKDYKSIAILKTLRNKEEIIDSLEGNDFAYKYIKRASFPEEEIMSNREEIIEDRDYISLILAKKN